MGHGDSMNPTKHKNGGPIPPPCEDEAVRLEKPVHHDNPVELVRVKLQDPVGYPSEGSSSMWSSEGITRSSRLFQRPVSSQALGDRPSSFALRAPRVRAKAEIRPAQSVQVTVTNISTSGNEVDNQAEEQNEYVRADATVESAQDAQQSWNGSSSPKSKAEQPIDNQEPESHALPLSLLKEDADDVAQKVDPAADIWTNPRDDFEDGAFLSNPRPATVSPLSSPEKPESHSASSFTQPDAQPSSRAVSVTSSCCETKTRAEGCRIPPGMSLIDRIQEDFPRTPSPEYGHFGDGSAMTGTYAFAGRAQHSPPMFGITEGMGQLRLGGYRAAPRYDAGRRSSHEFADTSRMPQHTADPRFSGGMHGHRSNFGRNTSEPFGSLYPGAMAQGFPSPYAVGIQAYPTMMGPTKSRWPAAEDSYRFQSSPFGFAPSDFASALPGNNMNCPSAPGYPVSYGGEYRGMKPNEKMYKGRPSYSHAEVYDHQNYGTPMLRPPMLHRSKPGGPRRGEFEYFHPVAHSYSSNSLLEEFNSTPKSEKWGLSAIKGHLFIFAKDQSGSRFIQQKLEKADDHLKADAFSEIFPNSLLLMTDVFGNYVIQKFLEYGSLSQQQLLVELMTSNMLSLALQVYGCRVIQRALEVTQVDEQLALIQQLKGHVMKCVVDQNGNHVLQKCIEAASWKRGTECSDRLILQRSVTGDDIQFIIDSFVGHAAALSTHSYGCRVIQRVLEHCSPDQIRPLLDEIIFKCRELVKDQFGNYVVQHVISHGEPEQRNIVMQAVFPEIARWSQHKYASNVVETCLEHATKAEITQIIDFILQCDESGSSCALLPMMKHMYGNYVVQKLLERADDHDRQRIVCIIRHNEDYLKRFTFGKHVLSRLEREEQANSYY